MKDSPPVSSPGLSDGSAEAPLDSWKEIDGDATRKLIAGASYDVLALATATVISVFKPGGPFRRAGEVVSPSA